ncbi:unnamed protein product [Lampetra fluviatilis]
METKHGLCAEKVINQPGRLLRHFPVASVIDRICREEAETRRASGEREERREADRVKLGVATTATPEVNLGNLRRCPDNDAGNSQLLPNLCGATSKSAAELIQGMGKTPLGNECSFAIDLKNNYKLVTSSVASTKVEVVCGQRAGMTSNGAAGGRGMERASERT